MKSNLGNKGSVLVVVSIALAAALAAAAAYYLGAGNLNDKTNDNEVKLSDVSQVTVPENEDEEPITRDETPDLVCVKEGQYIKWQDAASLKCCEGLSPVLNCDSEANCSKSADSVCVNCGDGVCGAGENNFNCFDDCAIQYKLCGNGACDLGETITNCSGDCPANYCEIACEEQGQVAVSDCSSSKVVQKFNTSVAGTCCCAAKVSDEKTAVWCGNKVCETGETTGTCPQDCSCGDGLCDPGENNTTCAKDCSISCLSEGKTAYTYTGGQITYWSGRGCCQGLAAIDGVCTKTNCAGKGTEVFSSDQQYSGCCAGLQMNWLRSMGTPKYNCTVCGNSKCDYGETTSTCPHDCGCVGSGGVPTDGDSNNDSGGQDCCAGLKSVNTSFKLDAKGSCQKTGGDSWICAACGDGVCGKNENKCNCAQDCGAALASCGNGVCETGENYSNCNADCGMAVALKPVIYLYPEKEESVNVKIDWDGGLAADYPDYDEAAGWNVVAYPDGRLVNKDDGKEYSYLFWEGSGYGTDYDMTNGFLVKGSDTKEFLQDILAKIGLAPKEYNEFIVYWYPKMKDNPYNIIHFAAEEYTSRAKLAVTPEPDSLLRVFMVYKPSLTETKIEPQTFVPFERKGFTVVEWGGSEIK